MSQPPGSPLFPRVEADPGEGKILKLAAGPPRYIVELYFRTPFEADTTSKAIHSAKSSAWGGTTR